MTGGAGRIGVLLTQWGEPEGHHEAYRKDVARRTRGEAAGFPGEPGTENFVGEFPFRSSAGLLPHAVSFPVPGLEQAHDSFGFYRLVGDSYVNVYDETVRVLAADVTADVIPAGGSTHRTARSAWGRSPHDDVDRFEGIVEIAGPTGIPDVDEVVYLAGIGDEDILFGDVPPRISEPVQHVNRRVVELLHDWFGDRVDVRVGAYADAGDLMPREDVAALDLVDSGCHRLVVARETTDSNSYANDFMSRGFIETALVRSGKRDGVEIRQVRQVGRTPEYNRALYDVITPLLQRYPDGSDVAIVYATYGLPFPGSDQGGPFSTPHPWAREVYHENAFLNYLSFRRFLVSVASDRLRLSFSARGVTSERRPDCYLGYAMSAPADFAAMPEAVRFRTLREEIDRAKSDGHREILVVLSHWIDDNRDTLLAVRQLQGLPVNSATEIEAGRRWIEWDETGARITFAPAFDTAIEQFAVGYAHRLRGGVEMFGEFPDGLDVVATGEITTVGGGRVEVRDGPLAGVALEVPPAPDPAAPYSFTADSWRVIVDASDAMLGAWDDFSAYLAVGEVGRGWLAAEPITPVVTVGPYRTIVNRPAVLTLPLVGAVPVAAGVWLFDHVAGAWRPVEVPPGGCPPRLDASKIDIDINVFGTYVVTTGGQP